MNLAPRVGLCRGRASAMSFALAAVIATALSLSGCGYFNPAALQPGVSLAQTQQALGAPTETFALPGGGQRVEYARGPMGKETWMLDFDSTGRLQRAEQVLTERRFNAILAGMSSAELRQTLGRPAREWRLDFQNQTVWSYRYDSLFCKWFQVGIDPAGRVVDTGYYPDPQCADSERPDILK
jgi:hypothetical protein